jgi:hypothetical protein
MAKHPTPAREGLDELAPEAVLQDLLQIAAPDGGAWELGHDTYWDSLHDGKTIPEALRDAMSAAAKDASDAVARVTKAMDQYYVWFPTNAQPATKPGARGFLLDLAEAFGRRSTPAHR